MIKIKLLSCLFFLVFFLSHANAITFKFGRSGKIIYDLKSGTFSAYLNSDEFLKDGFSTFKENNKLYSSKDYLQRNYSSTKISDQFGKGVKHTIELKGAGRPDMKQIFYAYDQLPYFLCEIEIAGASVSSNEMIPVQGGLPILNGIKEIRSVFVPFDNDTFISYNSKQLSKNEQQLSAEVGVIYDNTSFKGVISGSVNHRVWKTGVTTGIDTGGNTFIKVQAGFTEKDITRDVIPHGALKGHIVKSPMIFYGLFEDWRIGMNAYAKANRIAEPPIVFKWKHPTPLGWNSWGAMQEKISFDKIVKVTDFFADSLKAFRSEGTIYIDLDSYWDNMLKGGLEGDYSKLKEFADYVKKRGLKPGIYWAPFTDWGFKSGGDRRAEGGNYKFSQLWTKVGAGYHDLDGARALDPTHPGTQQRIALVIGKLKECGYEMIKIDFLGHAAIESDHFYDPKISTGMQAYEVGMSFLLKQLDDKMLVYAAISPTMASGRYIHMRRIACDAFKSIKDTKYTLNSLTYGWWQTHLYDYMDADHVVLGAESIGANRARTLSAIVTGTFIVGDDFSAKGAWTERAAELFQNKALLAVIRDGKSFMPIEANKEASEMFVKQSGNTHYLAIFNYGDKEKKFVVNATAIGLKSFIGYQLEDLFTHKSSAPVSAAEFVLAAGDATLIKITK
ncbi:alpha-galactosidase [Pedobacter hiemivivus]|uniref:Alpha-galactosidase n=1 Tax=Pedobacter hiemivivus TaxID=2530454 RepID=A0A4R0NFR7_9SPHI|nr:alpha-galactosidase [Pedobacter hiemivivus]TCC98587.1 alpha-galactosidase [Pedobacter hiemivivus]